MIEVIEGEIAANHAILVGSLRHVYADCARLLTSIAVAANLGLSGAMPDILQGNGYAGCVIASVALCRRRSREPGTSRDRLLAYRDEADQ